MLAYICYENCGYQRQCDVDDVGERVCPDCGHHVAAVSGSARDTFRSPPEGSNHASGAIRWRVKTGLSSGFSVDAFDAEDAVRTAISHAEEPQRISAVEPKNRNYRAY